MLSPTFYRNIIACLAIAPLFGIILTKVFYTFTIQDILRYPHVQIAGGFFAFVTYETILLAIYFWHKKYKLSMLMLILANTSYMAFMFIAYKVMVSFWIDSKLIEVRDYVGYAAMILGVLFSVTLLFGKVKENKLLWWYGIIMILFEAINFALGYTTWINTRMWLQYIAIFPSILLLINFLHELNRTKRKEFEEESVDTTEQ